MHEMMVGAGHAQWWEAALLGGLQGATEFLPVSSSGHLRLAELVMNARPPSLFFDVALHLGTLLAVVMVFRRPLAELIVAFFGRGGGPWLQRRGVRSVFWLLLASLPTVVVALLLEPVVEGDLTTSAVGGLLIANGAILLLAVLASSSDEPNAAPWGISLPVALLIGLAQGVAVLPGISRSGITITAALLLRVKPASAAEFSFLLSIPAILGAAVRTAGDVQAFSSDQLLGVGIGTVVAVVVGFFALKALLALIAKARFHHFAWYCFAVGVCAVVLGRAG